MAERRLKGPDPGGIRDDRPLDPVHRKVDHGFLPLQRGSLRVGGCRRAAAAEADLAARRTGSGTIPDPISDMR
jgi:hypothetical protein